MYGMLQDLLELNRDPALALVDGRIHLMNAAARAAFPQLRPGSPVGTLLPESLLADPSASFVCAAEVYGASYTVSSRLLNGVRFFSFSPEPPPEELRGGVSDGLLCGATSALFNIGLAADRLRSAAGAAGLDVSETLSVLFHNYYRLTRRLRNLSALFLLSEGAMPAARQSCNLVPLCGDLVSSVALMTRGRGARLEFSSDLTALPACVDVQKVERLILNLLSNSLRHTPRGGAVRLRLSRSGGNALLSVDDNGCGIPPEQLRSVFCSYRGRIDERSLDSEHGDGLGLALCRGIAELHGGTLILESRAGEGASVRVLLPLASPDHLQSRPAEPYDREALLLRELSELLDASCYRDCFPE